MFVLGMLAGALILLLGIAWAAARGLDNEYNEDDI